MAPHCATDPRAPLMDPPRQPQYPVRHRRPPSAPSHRRYPPSPRACSASHQPPHPARPDSRGNPVGGRRHHPNRHGTSADRPSACIDQGLHETFDSGNRRGVRPGTQVPVNCLGGEAVHDLTTCSRGGEYPLDTFGQRWFPKLDADPLGHLLTFDHAHRDSPRTSGSALFIGRAPTNLRAPKRAPSAAGPLHRSPTPRT